MNVLGYLLALRIARAPRTYIYYLTIDTIWYVPILIVELNARWFVEAKVESKLQLFFVHCNVIVKFGNEMIYSLYLVGLESWWGWGSSFFTLTIHIYNNDYT